MHGDANQKEVNSFVTIFYYMQLLQCFECVCTLLNQDNEAFIKLWKVNVEGGEFMMSKTTMT